MSKKDGSIFSGRLERRRRRRILCHPFKTSRKRERKKVKENGRRKTFLRETRRRRRISEIAFERTKEQKVDYFFSSSFSCGL